MFLLTNHAENVAGRLVPDLFLFFLKKALYEVKESGLQLSFNISIAFNLVYNKKNKLYKTLNYCSREMFDFDF